MQIHHAIYGEHKGGHALLAKSGGNEAPFEKLLDRTDLQGAVPPGTDWSPYLSGFVFDHYYILMLTRPDASASRGGMVRSHALFLPLEESGNVVALEPLLPLLNGDDGTTSIVPIGFDAERSPSGLDVRPVLRPGIADLADGLLSGGRLPLVWPGQSDFHEAMFSIWRSLPPDLRRLFHFRLSFGPQDAHIASFTVVAVPRPLLSRWVGFRVIRSDSLGEPTPATLLLLNESTASPLRSFSNEIGARLTKAADLMLVHQLHGYTRRELGTIDESIAALRLLLHLCPARTTGVEVRCDLIERLLSQIPDCTGAQLRSLRNIDFGAFPREPLVWNAVSQWVERNALASPEFADLISAAVRTPRSSWTAALWAGLDSALATLTRAGSAALWDRWQSGPYLADVLLRRLPDTPTAEGVLVESCPSSLPIQLGDALLPLLAERRWYRLHAHVLSAIYESDAALVRQLAVDLEPSSFANIAFILRDVPAPEVVRQCLQTRDRRLIQLAGGACVRQPGLLQQFDARDETWRAILTTAIATDKDLVSRLPHSEDLIEQLLEATLVTEPVDRALWAALAGTSSADLSRHPRRAALWSEMPSEVKELLLPVTADGWLSLLAADPSFLSPPEPELQDAIVFNHRIQRFLSDAIPSRLASACHLFLKVRSLGEAPFQQWLYRVIEKVRWVELADAKLLGVAVSQRGWCRSAEILADAVLRNRRHDFVPAVRECCELLGIVLRLRLRWSSVLDEPTHDELWAFFEQAATELYETGPEQDDVWRRAGGSYADLPRVGTGRDRWGHAIRLLRRGKGTAITPMRLLEVMRDDYPNNDAVRLLLGEGLFRADSPEYGKPRWLL